MTDAEAVQAFKDRVPIIHTDYQGAYTYKYISALITRIDSESGNEVLTLELYRDREVCIARPQEVYAIL